MNALLDLIFGKREPSTDSAAAGHQADAPVVAWRFQAPTGGASVEILRRNDGLFYYVELRHDRVVNPVWGDHEDVHPVAHSGLFGSLQDARRAAETELHWMRAHE